jgi:hypothetical protein
LPTLSGQQFTGQVLDFALQGQELQVRTREGLWRWHCAADKVAWPIQFDSRGHLASAERTYPCADPSGLWQLARGEGGKGFRLQRRNPDGTFTPCRWQEAGFTEDALQGIAGASGGRVVAATPSGLIEYDLIEQGGKPFLRFFRQTSGAAGEAVQLTRQGADVYAWSPSGPMRRYRRTGLPWPEVASPWPLAVQAHGVHWREMTDRAVLDRADFDEKAGRFQADVCLRLVQNTQGQVWLQTPVGWRLTSFAADGCRLSEPVSGPPMEASSETTWTITPYRTCRRTTRADGTDEVTFGFGPRDHPVTSTDPFGAHGRWPEEEAWTVLPHGGEVWIGTAGGVLHRTAQGQEKLKLPGRHILALWFDGKDLYCRTPEGDCVCGGSGWSRSDHEHPDAAPPTRTLSLPLGPNLTVTATERTTGSTVHTELADYEPAQHRFRHDIIQQLLAEPNSVLAVTPAGIQRLGFGPKGIEKHRMDLAGAGMKALRRGPGGVLCATAEDGTDWRCPKEDHWEPLTFEDEGNPFTHPLRNSLTRALTLERSFRLEGDRHQLLTAAGPVTLLQGKWATDFVTGTGRWGPQLWQGTPAGAGQINGTGPLQAILPWPADSGTKETPALAVDEGRLLCRLPTGPQEYDPGKLEWHPVSTRVFDVPEVIFDGRGWRFGKTTGPPRLGLLLNGYSSRFDWQGPDSNPSRWTAVQLAEVTFPHARLNGQGQFSFASVHAVTGRPGELWLAHGSGVACYREGGPVRTDAEPAEYLHAWHWRGEGKARLAVDVEGHVCLAWPGHKNNAAHFVYHEALGHFVPVESFFDESARAGTLNPFRLPLHYQGRTRDDLISVEAGPDQRTLVIVRRSTGRVVVNAPHPILDLREENGTVWILSPKGLWIVPP